MRRRKQILFYCLMVVMTLAVIEGMAQAAYYAAYGEFNGGGPAAPAGEGAAGAPAARAGLLVIHPYYGYTRRDPARAVNQIPPPRRADGVVLIGLLGGSLAWFVAPDFQDALEVWFREHDIPLRPVVLELADYAMKQPQQAIQITNTLALGGEYDIIANLDGHNELILAHENYFNSGVSPYYPFYWQSLLSGQLTDAEKALVSRIHAQRQRQHRLAAWSAAAPWRRSALYGIVNRYLRERTAAQILTLNRELAAARPGEYSLQRYGPPLALLPPPDAYDLSRSTLRVWYRGSVMLHELSRAAGAEYYHFLQPNQYVPDSKPLSDRELAMAYDADGRSAMAYRDAYPLWQRLGAELRQQGVNYHDLTQIFADNQETLYRDDCCHLNARGNELLAANMVQRLAPALRRRAALAGVKVGGGGGGGGVV